MVTVDPWLTAELLYIHRDTPVTDGHPDPLREWTEHSGGSDTTPLHWFAVRAWDPNGDPLLLVRELYADVPVTFLDTRTGTRSRTYGIARTDPLHLAREVWWTPSEELACTVARQVLEEQRCVYTRSGESSLPYVAPNIMRSRPEETIRRLGPCARTAMVCQHMPDGGARDVLRLRRKVFTDPRDPDHLQEG